jgi:hypothetical protein
MCLPARHATPGSRLRLPRRTVRLRLTLLLGGLLLAAGAALLAVTYLLVAAGFPAGLTMPCPRRQGPHGRAPHHPLSSHAGPDPE